MNLALEILVYGGVVPGFVALAVAALLRRFLPSSLSARNAAAIAFAVAFVFGYALLPSWAELTPTRHWHWLPYLAVIGAVVAPAALAAGVARAERWLLHLLLAVVAAWLLVPTWPTLQPSRPVFLVLLASYLFLLIALLDGLPSRLLGPLFVAILAAVALCTTILVAASVSVKFGQLAGIATAATVACLVSSLLRNDVDTTRGLVPVFTIVVGGLAFVGCVEPSTPLYALLLVPAAPLALWACASKALARLEGARSAAAQIAVVLVPLVVAILLVTLGDGAGATDGY
jgi:hypothetical protein